MIPDAKEFYGDEKFYNETKRLWSFPADGRRVRFGYGFRQKDFRRYKGPNWDFIGIDEASEIGRFSDGTTPLDMLLGWNRTKIEGQRVRFVLGSNPGGPGEEWIIESWAPWLDSNHPDPAESGEIRYVELLESGELVFHKKPSKDRFGDPLLCYTFIASSWKDNPYTQAGYVSRLNRIPGALGQALRGGIWGLGAKEDLWQIIPRDWVLAAQSRWRDENPSSFTAAGGDIAKGGKANTVLVRKAHGWFERPRTWPGVDTPTGDAAATLLFPLITGGESFLTYIDAFGVGADCYGELKKLGARCDVFPANEQTDRLERNGTFGFGNIRTEALWRLREALDPKTGQDLALPPDARILAQLTTFRYKMHRKGIIAEPKEATTARLGYSPDEADAIMMANFADWSDSSNGILQLLSEPFEESPVNNRYRSIG